MSEHIRHHEHHEVQHHNHEAESKQQERLQDMLREKAERAHDLKDQIPELSQKAKQEAISGNDLPIGEHAPKQPSSLYVSKELKQQTLHRTLNRIRKQLPKPERAFSKVIHQPVVDSVSRVSEKTVARPSGLLGGSICAFVGSTAMLWAAKHYGFAYNYLMFLILFVGGFFIGMIIEMLYRTFIRRRSSSSL